MDAPIIALLDANVIYPATLRDLLVRLAINGLYAARWTEAIHDEWTRSLLRDKPDLKTRQLDRTRKLMNGAVRDCLVDGYKHRIAELSLPDADDRHVLAAAIESQAKYIVTKNRRDFPGAILSLHGIAAIDPDDFLFDRLTSQPGEFLAAISEQVQDLVNPPVTREDLLGRFRRLGLNRTVDRLIVSYSGAGAGGSENE